MQIDKKEQEQKFIDNMALLLESVNKVSETNKKISQAVLIERFPNTYQLCNKDLNKFELLLEKGVYPYEYMDSWKRFKEESLTDKEIFYSELNKECITDEDYAHAQKIWDTFETKTYASIITYMFNLIQHCLQMYSKALGINA